MSIRGDSVCGVHYRVHSNEGKSLRWYPTKAEAIAAFERARKRKGLVPPLSYPPGACGDSITTNDIAHPRSTLSALVESEAIFAGEGRSQ